MPSRAGETGGLNTTSDPVELMCINCASSTLLVFEYCQQISTRIRGHCECKCEEEVRPVDTAWRRGPEKIDRGKMPDAPQ